MKKHLYLMNRQTSLPKRLCLFFAICSLLFALLLTGCGGGGGDPNDGDDITVTFSLGQGVSGNPPSSITIKNGTAMGDQYPKQTPRRTGFEFEGWFNSDKQYTSTTVINASGTTFPLTARWKEEDDTVEYAQNPAIHPGNHFQETGGRTRTARVNEEFAVSGLFASVENGAGVLTSKWYRTTSKADADAATAENPRGTVVLEQTATVNNPYEISLPFKYSEPAAGVFYFYVIVTNTNEHATITKTSSAITNDRLEVTVTE